jgi:DNA-directed RNA polymerase specialized sigma24 family protein
MSGRAATAGRTALPMNGLPSHKKDWVLTQEAFEILLAFLDRDRERAGEKYERVRQKLVKFFKWRGCAAPEEYADTTIDRVARRIAEGAELRVKDPYLYFHGVALNVLKEHWKRPEREAEALEGLPPSKGPAVQPGLEAERELERREAERRLDCLGECLRKLPPQSRELVLEYHRGAGHAKVENRRRLAEALRVPLNTLRIRVYRVRLELEGCVGDCVKRLAARDEGRPGRDDFSPLR